MNVHFIAIGGSAMHNLALELFENGDIVTGSDDEIYNPALTRLLDKGLSPEEFGWFPEKITPKIDAIILGMHAKPDNPELLKAQKLGIKIYSYPEFVYEKSKNKTRIVIAGSHGKTTTTSIILHVLKYYKIDFDYLVGSQIMGFDRMVKLSDAPIIVIEGDEYLSSPIDRQPKIMHYFPDVSVITGIAWDHINVFPTFENYIEQFDNYINIHKSGSTIFYYDQDPNLLKLIEKHSNHTDCIPYNHLLLNSNRKVNFNDKSYIFPMVGFHNQQNALAALKVCNYLGIEDSDYYKALQSFTGAAKRLQVLTKDENSITFLDFAHAPSKLKATTNAVKAWYGDRKLIAVFELHTFSSLNKDFLPMYQYCLKAADEAIVFYDNHTLQMKNMEKLDPHFVSDCFKHTNLKVCTSKTELAEVIKAIEAKNTTRLFMTSGNFGGIDILAQKA